MARAKSVLGLYLGAKGLAGIKLETSGEKLEVSGYTIEKYDSVVSDRITVNGALNKVGSFFGKDVKRLPLWSTVDSDQSVSLNYQLNLVGEQQISSLALWNFQQNTGLDMTGQQFNYHLYRINSDVLNGKLLVNGFSVAKSAIADYRKLLSNSGMQVSGLTPLHLAWMNAFDYFEYGKSNSVRAIIHVGEVFTVLRIVAGCGDLLVRQIKFGRQNIRKIFEYYFSGIISANFNEVLSDIESLRERYPQLDFTNFERSLTGAVKALCNRIGESINIVAKEKFGEVECFYTCGELSHFSFFNESIKGDLNLKLVKHFDVLSSIITEPPIESDDRLNLENALVLALSQGKVGSNLLEPWDEVYRRKNSRKLNRIASVIMIIAIIIFSIITCFAFSRQKVHEKINFTTQEVWNKLHSELVLPDISEVNESLNNIERLKLYNSRIKPVKMQEQLLSLASELKIEVLSYESLVDANRQILTGILYSSEEMMVLDYARLQRQFEEHLGLKISKAENRQYRYQGKPVMWFKFSFEANK
ncbi:MAG: hypothetical protein ACRC37_06220 [Lentisphaeria bacterium]